MKTSQSPQKKNNYIGFAVSTVVHACLVSAIFAGYEKQNLMSDESLSVITMRNFVAESGQNSASEIQSENSQNSNNEILEPEISEPIVEPQPEPKPVVETKPESVIEPKAVEKIPSKIEKAKISKPKKPKSDKKVAKKQNFTSNSTQNSISNSTSQNAIKGEISPQSGNFNANFKGNAKADNIGGKIQKLIASYAQKNYPQSAKRRHQTGVVKVTFTYAPSGEVSGVRVVSSSGAEALDNAVIKAIERTKSRFPVTSATQNFTVSVRFVLI